MELNGALSNPALHGALSGLAQVHGSLVEKAATSPAGPRPIPYRPPAVLETITAVLERADRPLPVLTIHAAAERCLGEPLAYSSVKGTLSNYAIGGDRRFRRVRHGWYEMAKIAEARPAG
jgi:hypothetical protein